MWIDIIKVDGLHESGDKCGKTHTDKEDTLFSNIRNIRQCKMGRQRPTADKRESYLFF